MSMTSYELYAWRRILKLKKERIDLLGILDAIVINSDIGDDGGMFLEIETARWISKKLTHKNIFKKKYS